MVSGDRGFTYIYLVIMLSVIGITLAHAGRTWKLAMQRERESELLFRGNQIRMAVAMYYESGHGGMKFLPRRIEDMLKDPRALVPKRYLRKPYADPMTVDGEWELVTDLSGRIKGVRSKSTGTPVKQQGFFPELPDTTYARYKKSFESRKSYREWEFVFDPAVQAGSSAAPAGMPHAVRP